MYLYERCRGNVLLTVQPALGGLKMRLEVEIKYVRQATFFKVDEETGAKLYDILAHQLPLKNGVDIDGKVRIGVHVDRRRKIPFELVFENNDPEQKSWDIAKLCLTAEEFDGLKMLLHDYFDGRTLPVSVIPSNGIVLVTGFSSFRGLTLELVQIAQHRRCSLVYLAPKREEIRKLRNAIYQAHDVKSRRFNCGVYQIKVKWIPEKEQREHRNYRLTLWRRNTNVIVAVVEFRGAQLCNVIDAIDAAEKF